MDASENQYQIFIFCYIFNGISVSGVKEVEFTANALELYVELLNKEFGEGTCCFSDFETRNHENFGIFIAQKKSSFSPYEKIKNNRSLIRSHFDPKREIDFSHIMNKCTEIADEVVAIQDDNDIKWDTGSVAEICDAISNEKKIKCFIFWIPYQRSNVRNDN